MTLRPYFWTMGCAEEKAMKEQSIFSTQPFPKRGFSVRLPRKLALLPRVSFSQSVPLQHPLVPSKSLTQFISSQMEASCPTKSSLV